MEEMTEEEKKRWEELERRRLELKQSGKIAEYKGLEFHLMEDGKFSIHATEEFKNTYRNTFELAYPCYTCDQSIECYEIPKEINGKPVSSISPIAFKTCPQRLKSVIIPDSVTNIAAECFSWLVNEKITTTIDSNNPAYMMKNGGLYTKDGKKLLKCFNSKKIFTVPDGVTTIEVNAFLGYRNLVALIIPTSVKRLEHGIIFGCNNFKTIFYKGTKADWEKIYVDESNKDELKNATVYFYSETPSGNSWRFGSDGVTPEITHTSAISKLLKFIRR